MIHRIPSVMGILLVSMLAHSVWTDRIVHAQEQSSPTLPNSDFRLLADIVFWQTIEDSENTRDFEDYLEQFPDGQFVTLAHRRRADAKGRALLDEHGEIDAIFLAARDNDIEVLEWLKAQGVDVHPQFSTTGHTPMHIAAMFNAVAAMEWLKAQGADINAQSDTGKMPMHWAAMFNAVAAMEWLKAQGADVNAQARDGNTPMHRAAEKDAVAAMEWLKAQGADINAQNGTGNTPMYRAMEVNAEDAMEWLRKNGGRK